MPLSPHHFENEVRFTERLQSEFKDALGEFLGLELEPIGNEVPIGNRRIDNVWKAGDGLIFCESQFGISDRRHFDQIESCLEMTYLGSKPSIIVWIAEGFERLYLTAIEDLRRRSPKQRIVLVNAASDHERWWFTEHTRAVHKSALQHIIARDVIPELLERMTADGVPLSTKITAEHGQRSGKRNFQIDVRHPELPDTRINLFATDSKNRAIALYTRVNGETTPTIRRLYEQFRDDPAVRFNAPRRPVFTVGIFWRGVHEVASYEDADEELPLELVDFFVQGSRILLLKAANLAPDEAWPYMVAPLAPKTNWGRDRSMAEEIAAICGAEVGEIFKRS